MRRRFREDLALTGRETSISESESELLGGDVQWKSFTRTHNCEDQPLDLTNEVNLVTQASVHSTEDKGVAWSSFQSLTVLSLSWFVNISPGTKSLKRHEMHISGQSGGWDWGWTWGWG